MRFLTAISAVCAMFFITTTVANASHPGTITDIVAASGGEFDRDRNDFDILLNAVLAADLAGALADPDANLTVFAPNDRAFIRLAREFGYTRGGEAVAFDTIVAALTELAGDPIPLLRSILLYHTSADQKTLLDLQSEPIVMTGLTGATIVVARNRLLDNEPDVRDPRFVHGATDIQAQNGIVQVINRVLIPLDLANTDRDQLPTIATIVAGSGGHFDHDPKDFDILLQALIATDLVGAFENPSDDLTVFAPNDAAFIRTARNLGFHGFSEAGAFSFIVSALTDLGDGDPIPLLTSILQYHVAPEALTGKALLESEVVSTLLGGATFEVDPATRRLVDNDPSLRNARVLVGRSSIRAANGFINTISRVLIPVDLSTL